MRQHPIYPTDQPLNPLPRIGSIYTGKISSIGEYGVCVEIDRGQPDFCGTTNMVHLHGEFRPAKPTLGEAVFVEVIEHAASGVYGKLK